MLKPSSDIEGAIEETLQALSAQGVRLPNRAEVAEHLKQCPDLITVLEPVIATAQSELPDAQLSLEVYHDPEIEDDHLVLYARFAHYSPDTMARIERARTQYRERLLQRGAYLLLTTDFAPLV